jgi:SAM-dependent methyltransferase
MQNLDDLRTYYLRDTFERGTLFDVWEEGRAWGDSVTPSTYSPAYRAWIVKKVMRYIDPNAKTPILSLGCGNAVVEAELRRRRCEVLAVDALAEAVALARRKGVDAVVGDVMAWEPPHRRWRVIYADGLLGHVYEPTTGRLPVLQRARQWLAPDVGVIVLSNDAPPEGRDISPAPGVPGFHWLSTRFIAERLQDAGLHVLSAEEFPYERPHSGERRRAVVVGRV